MFCIFVTADFRISKRIRYLKQKPITHKNQRNINITIYCVWSTQLVSDEYVLYTPIQGMVGYFGVPLILFYILTNL